MLRTMRIGGPAKTNGVLVFMGGHQPEKVAVGFRLKGFCLATVFAQADSGKNAQAAAAEMFGAGMVFGLKPVEGGQGNAEPAVQVTEHLKDLGFELVVGAGLRGWIGAYSFINS